MQTWAVALAARPPKMVSWNSHTWSKVCSNYRTIAFISYASKVMLKTLQEYMNRELPDVEAGFQRGTGTRDQIVNIHWIMEKAREFQKNILWSRIPLLQVVCFCRLFFLLVLTHTVSFPCVLGYVLLNCLLYRWTLHLKSICWNTLRPKVIVLSPERIFICFCFLILRAAILEIP